MLLKAMQNSVSTMMPHASFHMPINPACDTCLFPAVCNCCRGGLPVNITDLLSWHQPGLDLEKEFFSSIIQAYNDSFVCTPSFDSAVFAYRVPV